MPDSSPSDFPSLAAPVLRKSRRTGRSRWLRWGLPGFIALLLCMLALAWAQNALNGRPVIVEARPPPAAPPDPGPPPPVTPPNKTPTSDGNPALWEKSIVAIQSRGTIDHASHGSGFLVGDTRLVATSLHVSSTCTEAAVRLSDGVTYEVAGYAAVDPQRDLALLALKDAPRSLTGLPLNAQDDPSRRQSVWAIGHPRGIEFSVSKGAVSRVLEMGDLPAASQQFVRELAPGIAAAHWVQHSAELAPGSSGGPLLDAQGRVVGVNTWVDREARFSYALHARHLAALLEQVKPDSIVPLVAHATPEARTTRELWQLSAGRLRSLLDQGRTMRWQPEKADDYHALQQLAWAITVARMPDALSARGTLENRLDELAKAADVAAASLRKEKWNQLAQVTIVNEYAEAELRHPHAGLFFFATIQRMVEGEDGRRGLIAQLAGFDELLFLPLEDQLVSPEPGAQCLVLGVNYHGRVVQWGDNPLRLVSAPVIVPGLIVELGK